MPSNRLRLALVALCACATPALFAASAHAQGTTTLTVTKSGLQQGLVTDGIGEINCGSDCAGTYPEECTVENQHGGCTLFQPISVTLTTTVPSGFAVDWGVPCDEGPDDGPSCTVAATGTVNVHYDDTTAPSVSLTSPTIGARRQTIALAASATDPQSGVQRVEFLVGGVVVGPSDTSAPYGHNFDTTSVSDGAKTVTARAFNYDGDSATSSVNITVDNTNPVVGVSGPNGQTFGPGTTQTWTISASDATSGLASVQCSVVAQGDSPVYGPCSGGSSHTVTNRPGGAHTFSTRATDNAGNEIVQTRAFTIDATAPATTIETGPADGSSSSEANATFTFAAGEPGSTFACRVYPAALTPPAFGACSGADSHTAAGFAPGTYSFEVVATDPYGNVDATPAKRTFTVTSAPAGGTGAPGGSQPSGPGGDSGNGADTSAPTVTLSVARQKLGRVRSRGLAVEASCSEPARLSVELVLPGALAKRLGLTRRARPVVIGSGVAASCDSPVSVKLSRRARSAAKRLSSLKLQVVVVATDATGNASAPVEKNVTLKR